MKLKAWLKALRAHFLTATVAPILVGTGAAWYATGSFDLLGFFLALVGGMLIHLGANMSDDYFDSLSETDALNASISAYSGGSRVIQEGLIPARQILVAALGCMVAGSLMGIYLVVKLQSIPLLVIGTLGVFCAYFYTGTPLRLGYRGLAEIICGIGFGPMMALGAYFVQTPGLTATAVAASIPVGLLLAMVLVINEFPDFDSDGAVGKRTIVVILGKSRAVRMYHVGILIPFIWVPGFVIAGIFPAWSLLVLASLPLAVKAFLVSRAHFQDSAKILGANMSTFFLHLSFNLLLSLGFLLG